MFQTLLANIVTGFIRHSLTTLGGGLVASGYISSDQDSQAIGAILTVLGIAWSAWQKYKAQPAPVTVKDTPVEVHVLPDAK